MVQVLYQWCELHPWCANGEPGQDLSIKSIQSLMEWQWLVQMVHYKWLCTNGVYPWYANCAPMKRAKISSRYSILPGNILLGPPESHLNAHHFYLRVPVVHPFTFELQRFDFFYKS